MIYKYEELTHQEWSSLPRDKTLIMMPCSPLEEHSIHLPLGVDPMIARYFSEKIASELDKQKSDWNVVILPTLYAGCDTLIFRGSIEIPQRVIRDLLYAQASKIADDGFKYIIVAGAHGGPRHVVVLEEVAAKISWRYPRVRMISAAGPMLVEILRGRFAERILTKLKERNVEVSESMTKAIHTDYHAGMVETSLMMVIRPDLVKPEYKTLEPAIIDKPWKIHRRTAKKAGAGLGHLGSPEFASREMGEAITEVFMETIFPKILNFLDSPKKPGREFRSFLYYIPLFRSHFSLMLLMTFSFGVILLSLSYFLSILSRFGNV